MRARSRRRRESGEGRALLFCPPWRDVYLIIVYLSSRRVCWCVCLCLKDTGRARDSGAARRTAGAATIRCRGPAQRLRHPAQSVRRPACLRTPEGYLFRNARAVCVDTRLCFSGGRVGSVSRLCAARVLFSDTRSRVS